MAKTQVPSNEKMQSSERASSLGSTYLTTDYFLATNLPGYVNRLYKELTEISPNNARIICNYIEAEKVEINIKESTKTDKIKKLCWLSRYLNHKSFNNMTKQDVVNYLDSVRRPESEDPGHRSIGTYNGIRIVLLKFFRWLYNPDEPDHRKRATPPCMNGIKELRRKERSPYRYEYPCSCSCRTFSSFILLLSERVCDCTDIFSSILYSLCAHEINKALPSVIFFSFLTVIIIIQVSS